MKKSYDLDSMTREELIGLVRFLLAVAAEVHELRAEVKDLKGKLALNSSNSSKAPPSDFAKPRPADPRKAGELKVGGQKGHPGATLHQVEACRVDLVVEHGPSESMGPKIQTQPMNAQARFFTPKSNLRVHGLNWVVRDHGWFAP